MAKDHIYILGINAYDHDVSACLLRDGAIAFAIAKERITREKHDTGFYQEVIDYCLKAEGITLDDVSLIVRNCYVLPVEDMDARLSYEDVPEFMDTAERRQATKSPLFLTTSDKVITLSHHLAHAYSAFAACPFEEGVVMVVDGVGNYATDIHEPGQLIEGVNPLARESESFYKFSGAELETLKKVWLEPTRGFLSDEFFFMPGLGALYSRVSSYIFADWNKCGEVMGLAPYGRSGGVKPLAHMRDGELDVPEWTAAFRTPWLPDSDENWEKSRYRKHWEDLAWRVQDDTENVLLARAKWLRETTGAKNLCIAGGVGLNCVANGRLARESGFDNVWIQPASGDDGIAIGCAYYGHLHVQKNPRSFVMEHAYLGRTYSDRDVEDALSKGLARLETAAHRSEDVCAEAAKLLADGNVLGWFQDRSEFGPRALGNRSLLADPRSPEMKDTLNSRVKHRQAFRPFAPIVTEERAAEIFEGPGDSPYMLMAKRVRPEWRDRIPAIVHVDGTARVQTVRKETNERLHRLLTEFEALTGVPVLINTSFNVKGEPIVETPRDAVECFLSTGIDQLVLHDTIVAKTAFHRAVSPVMGVYSEITTMVRAGLQSDKD
jgi:carbamoyltransferase